MNQELQQQLAKPIKIAIGVFLGCAGLSLVLGLLITGGTAFGLSRLMDLDPLKMFAGIEKPVSVAPPGDAGAFDPIKAFMEVKTYAGNVPLVEMTATHVRSDGTINLMADLSPRPTVSYDFVEEFKNDSEDAPPIGAGSGEGGVQWRDVTVDVSHPNIWRHVTQIGGSINASYRYKYLGMGKTIGSPRGSNYDTPLPDPLCPFVALWAVAMQKGTPSDAVAWIRYNKDGYDFWIRDTKYRYRFDTDCRLIEK
ncbi:MAG: hypothetical protein WC787_00520 [Patescibacteria group bacterium]|jgi:hypothetical protein